MRAFVRKYLAFGFVFLLLGTTGIRTAEAVQLTDCVSANYIYFPQGLSMPPLSPPPQPQVQNIAIGAVIASCTPVGMSAVPVKFVWNGSASGASCLTALSGVSAGAGTLDWDDNTSSSVTLASVVVVGTIGVAPAVAKFRINSGHGAGGSFTVAAAFLPSTNNMTSCAFGNLIYYVAGVSNNNFVDLGL